MERQAPAPYGATLRPTSASNAHAPRAIGTPPLDALHRRRGTAHGGGADRRALSPGRGRVRDARQRERLVAGLYRRPVSGVLGASRRTVRGGRHNARTLRGAPYATLLQGRAEQRKPRNE